MQHLPSCRGVGASKMHRAQSHNGFGERENLQHRVEVGGMGKSTERCSELIVLFSGLWQLGLIGSGTGG